MPDNSADAAAQTGVLPDLETTFVGIDTRVPANRLPPGYMQQADNVFVRGTELWTRPGFVGMLTAKMTGASVPVYELTEYLKLDGTRHFLFAQNGKLWQCLVGSPSAPVEVKLGGTVSFAFTNGGAGVFLRRYGKYVYGIDSQSTTTGLFRINLEAGICEAYNGLVAPTAAPVATLTSVVLDTCASATGFYGRLSASEANIFPNSTFQSGGAAITPDPNTQAGTGAFGSFPFNWNGNPGDGGPILWPTSWPSAASPATHPVYVFLQQGQTLTTLPAIIVNEPITNGPAPGSAGVGTYCDRCYVSAQYYNFPNGTPSATDPFTVSFTVQAYTDNACTVPLGGPQTKTFTIQPFDLNATPAGPLQSQFIEAVFEFGSLVSVGSAPILSWSVVVTRGNDTADIDGLGITRPVFRALGDHFNLSTSANPAGVLLGQTESSPAFYGRTMGCRLIRDYGHLTPTTRFASEDELILNFAAPAGVSLINYLAQGWSMAVSFCNDGGTTESTSNAVTIDPTGTFATVDVSTIPLANRASIRYFTIIFQTDILPADGSAPTAATSPLFILTGIGAAGNLQVGGSYTYILEEILNVTTADDSPSFTFPPVGPHPVQILGDLGDVIESSGSLSAAITPTSTQAQTQIVLPVPVNDGTSGTQTATHYRIFRGGGALADSAGVQSGFFWYELATVSISADASGVNWSWNHTTKTFVDNIRDGDLLLSDVYQFNRDEMPVGGLTSICFSGGRLWVAQGSTVYASWLLNSDIEAGLYTSLAVDPTDPAAISKGYSFTLDSPLQADNITALVPFSVPVVVLRQNSLGHIEGTDPTNYAYVQRFLEKGIGCLAPRGHASDAAGGMYTYGPNGMMRTGSLFYLAAVGLVEYNTDVAQRASRPLEGVLNSTGQDGSPIIAAAAYTQSAVVLHDDRRYLIAPTGGDSAPTVVYVFDTRQQGWTRWLTSVCPGFTGGVSLSGSADTLDLYFAGQDGQIYHVGGNVDKATAGGSAVPIPFTVTTRAYGKNDNNTVSYFYENTLQQFYLDVATNTQSGSLTGTQQLVSLTLSATGNNRPRSPWSKSWFTNAPPSNAMPGDIIDTTKAVKITPSVRGTEYFQTLSASTTDLLRIRALGLDSTEGRRER